MRQVVWRRMVAWALVGVLVVGLWGTPGWARKTEEKPKPMEGEIAGLLVALEDEYPKVKELVFKRLVQFDQQALKGSLKQPDVIAKKSFDILKDEKIDANVRMSAASALGNLGEAAKPYAKYILDVLKNKKLDATIRGHMASVLGNLGETAKPYAKDILDILKDEKVDARVRERAASALGNLGEAAKPYVKDILGILKDEKVHFYVRMGAASVLVNLGDAAPYVKDILDILKYDMVWEKVERTATSTLVNLGDAAKPYAKDILDILKDKKVSVRVRMHMASALGNLGDAAKPYVKDLLGILKDEEVNKKEFVGPLLVLVNLGDAAKPYAKDILDILKDKKVHPAVRINAASALGNLGDAAKPYAKDILDILKDKKVDVDVRVSAASALVKLDGDAAKLYVTDILDILKDEKVYIDGRKRAASVLANLGDVAKPYKRDWAKLLSQEFLLTSFFPVYLSDISEGVTTVIKLGGLTLSDSLPIVNAIYSKIPELHEGRFLVKLTTLGDKDTVTLLNWVGKPKSTPKKLTHDEAKSTLKIFQTAWDNSTDLPELHNDLATQIREVANNRNITWKADDIPLLTGLATALKTGGYTSADLDSAIQSITLYQWGSKILTTLLLHITFWIALIFFYPRSPQIQAIFFWNPWVRNIAGLGYVSFLLTWIPFLRDRLLAPFRTSLLADANLLNQDPNTHYFPTSQVRPRNSTILQPLPKFQGQLILEGESGLGKTMYLRQLVQSTNRNTVYLTAQRCENGVLEAIQTKLEGNAKDPNFLQNLIYSRALDICIDGLNEVSPDTRATITKFLESNFQGNFILTTQPLNGWNPPKTAKIYELQPLTPDQIHQFLHSRIDTLPTNALITGQDYLTACDRTFNQYKTQLQDNPTDEARKIRRIFSNPMDLTLIAHTIAANEIPDPFRLQEQEYQRMSDRYSARFNQAFPLKQFAEAVYNMRLSDQDSIPVKDFEDELEIMEENKMVIARTSREITEGETPKSRTLWNFRHDKILEYFLVQQFLGNTPEAADRTLEHLDDPRFRGVYFLLADLLPLNEAKELRETLIQYAVDTQDHTVSDRFIELLRPRRDNALPL